MVSPPFIPEARPASSPGKLIAVHETDPRLARNSSISQSLHQHGVGGGGNLTACRSATQYCHHPAAVPRWNSQGCDQGFQAA